MVKITGLDKLQKDLKEAQQVLEALHGELGKVNFNPHDPSSIEAAIQTTYTMIDDRAGAYASNRMVRPIIEKMKEKFRENILRKAAASRLQEEVDK